MNDKKLEKLLEFISEKAGEKYAILTAEDTLKQTDLTLSEEELFNAFNLLNSKGYILQKYNDGKSFCCVITSKGKDVLERVDIAVQPQDKNGESMPYFLIFLSAFLGGVLGCLTVVISGLF